MEQKCRKETLLTNVNVCDKARKSNNLVAWYTSGPLDISEGVGVRVEVHEEVDCLEDPAHVGGYPGGDVWVPSLVSAPQRTALSVRRDAYQYLLPATHTNSIIYQLSLHLQYQLLYSSKKRKT